MGQLAAVPLLGVVVPARVAVALHDGGPAVRGRSSDSQTPVFEFHLAAPQAVSGQMIDTPHATRQVGQIAAEVNDMADAHRVVVGATAATNAQRFVTAAR